jgi:hypothetical protein
MSGTGSGRVRAASAILFLAAASIETTASAQEFRVLSEEVRQFTSPLILDMSLDPVLDRPAGEKWSTDKTRLFSCRGVTIEFLEFRVRPEPGLPRRVEIRTVLNNNSGKDKRSTVTFECVDDDKVLCIAVVAPSLEQGDTEKNRAVLVLRPPDRWTQLPRPRLRIRLTVVDY